MGTSNVRLVKATSAQEAPKANNPEPKRFTNWSRQFLLEREQELASQPSARQQWASLFPPKEIN